MHLTQKGSQLLENVHLTFILQCILSKNDIIYLFLWAYLSFLFCLASCVVITNRLYQAVDEVVSSVRTNVKGVAYTNNRIWDTAEYTIPMQASLNLMSV